METASWLGTCSNGKARTAPDETPPTGRSFETHERQGVEIHLLVRNHPRLEGRGAPFVYRGPVDLVD
jgi:hypothetical protein